MLSRLTRAAYNRDKEKDRMLQHAWSPDRRAPWQHSGICYSSIYSHVQLLALMWSLYHEVGRISAALSHQAVKLQLFPQPYPSSWVEMVTWLSKTVLGCLMRWKELQRMVSAGPWKIYFLWQVTNNPKPAMCECLLTDLTLCLWWFWEIRCFTVLWLWNITQKKMSWSHLTHLLLHPFEDCLQWLEQRSYHISSW